MDPTTTMQGDFIGRLCRTHEGQLQNCITQIVGSPEIARELVQDSFARIYESYRPEQFLFPRALLFHVATNFALMHLRRRRLERSLLGGVARHIELALEDPDHHTGPEGKLIAAQLGEHLARAIKALRPNLREVFVMAHVEGRCRKEIATAIGISEKCVDKRMTVALRKCREELITLGIDLTEVLGLVTLVPFVWALSIH